ncbi:MULTISPECIES: porin family protein [Flavobacterium]|uniref:Porin family protein n=1 Tax=Flavobacterium hankyongi TaxID=1176532 RepID=A0ABP9A5S8_9FLAO|nr:porin family protein [Flavobacterium sp. N1846]
MKKVLLTTLVLFTFGFANAQKVKFGAKAGLNLSNLSFSEGSDPDSKIGFHLGGFAEIGLTDKFAIQPELLFSTQGAKTEESESYSIGSYYYSYNEENKFNLNYINLPVIAKFYVIKSLALEAGPQVGFLVGAKSKYEWSENDGGDIISGSGERDIKKEVKGTDISFNIGASYNFTDNLFAGLRYNIGLTDIDDTASNNEIKNNVLCLSVGYKF